jgi:hypothetical protein
MTREQYVILAYVIGLGLMLGYGLVLWIEYRSSKRRQKRR